MDDPDSHDFDWVTARYKCSVADEFVRLKSFVEACVATRRKLLAPDTPVDCQFTVGKDEFTVTRSPVSGIYGRTYTVTFTLRIDHIHVTSEWDRTNEPLTLRVTLNDTGECRLVVNGEGEYLRWQVARRVLCGLLFDGPR